MAEDFDPAKVVGELKERAAKERAAGGYPDDLAGIELEFSGTITDGFDLLSGEPRVRFRPELGFSSKRVIGPPITLVKRFYLRLLFHVFDDLARQTDKAIARVEAALALEVATREGVERELRQKICALESEVRLLQERSGSPAGRQRTQQEP